MSALVVDFASRNRSKIKFDLNSNWLAPYKKICKMEKLFFFAFGYGLNHR
jgi:hypothetical protein